MSECMSNFQVHIKACSSEALKSALKIAFMQFSNAAAWQEHEDWLVLYWNKTQDDKNSNLFPSKMNSDTVFSTINSWLKEHKPKESYPNLDGSCSEGFELTTVHARGWSYEIFRIRPIWAHHHK